MGTRKGLDGYTHLKHLIQLWQGYWLNQMAKMNEAVGMNNHVTMNGEGKRLFCRMERKEFWEYIGCVTLEVT